MNLVNFSFPRTVEFHLFPEPQQLLSSGQGGMFLLGPKESSFPKTPKSSPNIQKWAQPKL